ncbi:MAG: UDP-glucose 4-epimerase GalE, partial [Bacteroidota bacterium]
MKIFVIGGAGYIGSHTAKILSESGYNIIVVDNLCRGQESSLKWGTFEKVDILDYEKLSGVFSKHKPEAVIHFAAYAYVGESVSNPIMYYHNNVSGTVSLLKAMISAGCRNLVFSSTCATYGIPERVPITECQEQNPVNPYGMSKLMVERILEDLSKSGDLTYVALRYFNAAGADPDGEIGECHDPETHLIPLALEAAANSERTLSVFGDDYDTIDGSCIRDYIHVCDLAEAHTKA